MPDHFDHGGTATESRASADSGPRRSPWSARVGAHVETAWRWGRRHVRETQQWARAQPPQRLVVFGLAALAAVGVAWLLLSLLAWVFSALGQWLSADAPAAAPQPERPPWWLVEIQHAGLWESTWGQVLGYADGAAAAAGTPGWLLLATWITVGGCVLLGSWWARRAAACRVTFVAWLAATAWVVYTSTPGGSPVPAAILAALGALVSVLPWSAVPVAVFIALGVIPAT